MAECEWCGREMLQAHSCAVDSYIYAEGDVPRIPYGQEPGYAGLELPERCHDCGVKKGGYHHKYCDMEECPTCHGQAISCGCGLEGEPAASGEEGHG